MINLKKTPFYNDVKRVLMPLFYTLWRYAATNHPGIDFVAHFHDLTIEVSIIPLSTGFAVSRTVFQRGKRLCCENTTENLSKVFSWSKECVTLGAVLTPGTYKDFLNIPAAA